MPDYAAGEKRIVNKFFIWKTLEWEATENKKTVFLSFAMVRQELILRYKVSIPGRFGQVAPAPKKTWRSIKFV